MTESRDHVEVPILDKWYRAPPLEMGTIWGLSLLQSASNFILCHSETMTTVFFILNSFFNLRMLQSASNVM